MFVMSRPTSSGSATEEHDWHRWGANGLHQKRAAGGEEVMSLFIHWAAVGEETV
jgi:hypothetical protein